MGRAGCLLNFLTADWPGAQLKVLSVSRSLVFPIVLETSRITKNGNDFFGGAYGKNDSSGGG
ncbi:hypothetical protein AW736_26085 [Termitidicoccus mucosus]|uniref:Uncharacterized protein n=1 Tax=Termitidicoccus mucosus TaxID=1184151 RepID=A0A178IRR6_9BACT|nr:hypothetical protein AW736_26085 [Opitutaceae bacterium TSB47]